MAVAWASALGVSIAFYAPGLSRLGRFPVPLDDTFIHFGFARGAALGHPFEWIPGNGYSSGATSVTYPFALAPGWLLGFRGEKLAVFAAALAVLCVVDFARSVATLVATTPRVALVASAAVVCVPLLDWSLFSGMETALLAAVLGRALLAARRAERADAASRSRRQLRAGAWLAVLVATRPETVPLAAALAIAIAHAGRSTRPVLSLARAMGPALSVLGAFAIANRALTGEWSAAGAVRKLLVSNPYAAPLEIAVETLKNAAVLRAQAFDVALGGAPLAWIALALMAAGVLDRRTRRLAIALALGAVGVIALASLNATARFQNFRYAAPALLMIVPAAALGASAIARRGRAGAWAGAALLAAFALAPAREFPRQIDNFTRASANIAGQQIEVAARLRAMGARRVLVGDAGAIPYVSGAGAIDAFGLGGYRGLPFARASVHGTAAVVELLERLAPDERPDVLALYPGWWVGLADVFGRPVDRVRIDDNVICGADEKVIYAADWSALESAPAPRDGEVDALDVADLVDERAHDYDFPAPAGGFVVGAVHALNDGTQRFDGGRVIPDGRAESFTAVAGSSRAKLVIRTDAGPALVLAVRVERDGRVVGEHRAPAPARDGDRWFEIAIAVGEIRAGDRVRVTPEGAAFRSFHMWLMRDVIRDADAVVAPSIARDRGP